MAMKLQATRSYLWYAGWNCKQEDFDRKHASMSKVFASEESLAVCVEALELWGATGYMKKIPSRNCCVTRLVFCIRMAPTMF